MRVEPSSVWQMQFDIHALMQDADDNELLIVHAIECQMGTDCVFEVTIADANGAPDLPPRRQIVERVADRVDIGIRLCGRPMVSRIEPDIFEVGFRLRRQQNRAASSGQVSRAGAL